MKIFSGIRPSGGLHIGNFLGAIKQWLELQEENQTFFCIVDLHAITTPYNPEGLQKEIKEILISYLAAGLNPQKSTIFIQSQVKEHAELAWLLSTITPVGQLQRMTQFKEKSRGYKEVNAGLLNYPVLMASDILLYNTDKVPVGEDQAQHVELTRDIANRFNNKFGKTLKMPETLLPETGRRIMSLTEPTKKMSKSDSEASYILLFDNPEDIKKKIMSAQTDTGKEIKYRPQEKPGISNMLNIYSIFSDQSVEKIEEKFKGKGYKEFKERLSGLLIEKLQEFREKKKELKSNESYLQKVLEDGQKQAGQIAMETMRQIKKNMGLRQS